MSLKQRVISGLKYSSLSTIVTTAAQFLRIVILTRFLEKSDFGLVAIVTLVLGFTNLFSDLGFSVALMHKQDVTRKEFSSIYWLNTVVNIFLFLVLCAISPFVARFYSETILSKLIPLLGCQLIIDSAGKLYAVQMQKEMKFKFISIRDIVGAAISLIIAVVAAWSGLGIYSIILSTLSNVLIVNVLNFISGYRNLPLVFHFSISETKGFLKIGLYQTGAQILDYFSYRIDILLIGKLFGTADLGIYNLAKELILKPVALINSVINKVSLPLFSHIQSDIVLLRSIYCKVLRSLTFVTIPVLTVLFLCSDQCITIVYGAKYADVTPLFEILILWGLGVAIVNPSSILIIARGETKLGFYWTIIRLAINTPVIVLASLVSLKTVAIGQDIIAISFTYFYWRYVINKMIPISFKEYFRLIIPTLLICIIGLAASKILMTFLTIDSAFLNLMFFGGIFTLFYLILSWLFNREMFSIIDFKKFISNDT
jgi:O-antigen/teichoic acid export membrane protein